jgi:hypothetical protein
MDAIEPAVPQVLADSLPDEVGLGLAALAGASCNVCFAHGCSPSLTALRR